jgi:serralysin
MATYTLNGTFTSAPSGGFIVRYARFTVTTAGEVTLTAANRGTPPNGSDAEMYLFTSTGQKLAFDQDSGRTTVDGVVYHDAKIIINLPVGEYFLAVSEYGSGSTSNQVSFSETEALSGVDANNEEAGFPFEITITEGIGTVVTPLLGAADESLTDTAGNDQIFGLEANDTITSRNGLDSINGGTGTDTLVLDWSASGSPASNSDSRAPMANGTVGGFDGRFLRSDLGDMAYTSIERFVVSTGGGNDVIITASGDDIVNTGAGNDFVNFGSGNDQGDGGAGEDGFSADLSAAIAPISINLETGVSLSFANFEYLGTLTTGSGDDVVVTRNINRAETINTGAGNDSITSRNGLDSINGGTGTDTLVLDWSASDSPASNIDSRAPAANETIGGFDGRFLRSDLGDMAYTSIERFVVSTGGGNDVIITASGDDVVNTGAGNDFVNFGSGNDQGDGGTGEDGFSADLSSATSAIGVNLETGASLSFANFEYIGTLTTGAGDDVIVTRNINRAETINTGAGNDSITSRSGTDSINGGTGTDTLVLDWSASDSPASNIDSRAPAANQTIGGFDGRFLRSDLGDMAYTSIERFVVSTGGGNDVIITASGDDVVKTGAGNDFVNFGSGNDQGDGGAGEDGFSADLSSATSAIGVNLETGASLSFANFEYIGTLTTGAGDDVIVTRNVNRAETINTGAGNDSITSRSGSDSINGGTGTDTLVLDWSASDSPASNIDSRAPAANETTGGFDGRFIRSDVGDMAYTSIERFVVSTGGGNDNIITASGDDEIKTGAGSDAINAGAGNDLLDGGAGDDTMIGGAGNDIFIIDSVGDIVTENAGEGTDEIRTTLASYSLAARPDVENLTGLGTLGQTLTGNDADNRIEGGLGNDTLDGGAGRDRAVFSGNRSDYTVTIANGVTTVRDNRLIAGNEGTDTLTGIETLQFADGSVINGTDDGETLTGTSGDDTINAMGGNDIVNAGEGEDTVNGGSGDDTLNGEGGNDTLNGDAGNDTLNGGDGDDVLVGGTPGVRTEGSDILNGGAGNDILVYQSNASGNNYGNGSEANGGDGVDVLIADFSAFDGRINTQIEPDDLGGFTGQYSDFFNENVAFTRVERFEIIGSNFNDEIITGTGNDVISAGADNDYVDARGGNDTIDGGTGNNTLYGGAGDDRIALSSGGDDIVNGEDGNDFLFFGGAFTNSDIVEGGAGTDTLALLGNYDLTFDTNDLSGIERLFLLAGNAVDPEGAAVSYNLTTIDANVGAEGLFVTAASLREGESLRFNGTAETDGAFRIQGGAGADVFAGGAKNDFLQGGAGDDQLFGLGGNDTLIGGLGTDLLRGGLGRDTFRFDTAQDSSLDNPDSIADFNKGFDKIDLSRIDANTDTPEEDAFTFIGGAAFTGTAGELRSVFDFRSGQNRVEGDVNGDGEADFAILVTVPNPAPLVATDFIL